MARQPRNVLVYPFARHAAGHLFLILKRSDNGIWQGVSGGVEDSESEMETVLRELREELGVLQPPPVVPLTMFSGARRTNFSVHHLWPPKVYIVEKHFFAADFSDRGLDVTLSDEHTDSAWLPFAEAEGRLEYSDDRTGLWELHQRILVGDLHL
jgi:dATP pyrophosphohydrolase